MNGKRFLVASAVTYVVVQAMELVINNVLMKSANESLMSLWRPNMMSRIWVMYAVGVLVALLFTYIFVKGREGKGIAEGVRYGIIIWLFVSVPMSVSMWVLLPIPISSSSDGCCTVCWRCSSRDPCAVIYKTGGGG